MFVQKMFIGMLATLTTASLTANAVHAAPATQPAAKPGTPATQPAKDKSTLTDGNSSLQSCEQYAFRFRVPKEWKAMDASATGGMVIYAYVMTDANAKEAAPAEKNKTKKPRSGGGASATPKPPEPNRQDVIILASNPCHPGATLDDQIKALADQVAKATDGSKVISDEPAQLGGDPARALTIEKTSTFVVVDPKGKKTETPFKVHERHVIAIRNGKRYDAYLTSDVKNLARNVKLFDRALASFEYTEPLKNEEKKTS